MCHCDLARDHSHPLLSVKVGGAEERGSRRGPQEGPCLSSLSACRTDIQAPYLCSVLPGQVRVAYPARRHGQPPTRKKATCTDYSVLWRDYWIGITSCFPLEWHPTKRVGKQDGCSSDLAQMQERTEGCWVAAFDNLTACSFFRLAAFSS
jgi:hypothetical protein